MVVPAYCEERLIGRTLDGIPSWVDSIHVVDDASPDATLDSVQKHSDSRIVIHRHVENRGVGAAIVTGYRGALAVGADVIAVMAGDNQMHPDDLQHVVGPVLQHSADYVKGNRFRHPMRAHMPMARRVGGQVLAGITRAATGLAVDDTQCGFTAIAGRVLRQLPLEQLWPRYGYPNDLLGMLAARGYRVREVTVRPVYADEKSGLRVWHMLSIGWVIARRWRLERSDSSLSLAREA